MYAVLNESGSLERMRKSCTNAEEVLACVTSWACAIRGLSREILRRISGRTTITTRPTGYFLALAFPWLSPRNGSQPLAIYTHTQHFFHRLGAALSHHLACSLKVPRRVLRDAGGSVSGLVPSPVGGGSASAQDQERWCRWAGAAAGGGSLTSHGGESFSVHTQAGVWSGCPG